MASSSGSTVVGGVSGGPAPTVAELDTVLKDLVKWEPFAYHLPNIEPRHVKIIQAENREDIIGQKLALYNKWLSVCTTASWRAVVRALEEVEENKMADNIRKRCITQTIVSSNSSSTASAVSTSISPLVDCITTVLTKHYATLRNVTECVLSDLAAQLFSAGILPHGLHRNPTYDQISSCFIEGLGFQETEDELSEYCRKYFRVFYSIGGPLKLAADKVKRDITEEAQRSHRINFTIPR